MSRINTPINQVKLTNVSIVRLKKHGKRFEIACYKNKVVEYRKNIETDIENVLQINQVFTNVSKGQVANKADLEKCFGSTSIDLCVAEILKKGELQVGEKERSAHLSTMYRDIATIISEKCINPSTKRPYPVSMIEKAMQDLHYSINPTQSAKKQALEVMKLLKEDGTLEIEVVRMRIKLLVNSKDGKRLKDQIHELISTVEEEDWSEEYELVCLIDPGKFRILSQLIQDETKGKGRVEVLTNSVEDVLQGDQSIQ